MSIVNFKTDAWKESAAAQAYHDATSSAALQMQILRDRNYREYFAEFVAPGKLVLDVGCGSGIIGNGLHDDGYRVVGSDVSPGMLECFEAEKVIATSNFDLGTRSTFPLRMKSSMRLYHECSFSTFRTGETFSARRHA